MARLSDYGFTDEEIIRIRLICTIFNAQEVRVLNIKNKVK